VLTEATGRADQRLLRQPARHELPCGKPSGDGVYPGVDRETGEVEWTGTDVDLIFGSNSQLRADRRGLRVTTARQKFVNDFVPPGTR
jgi:catalase-peroxidase